MKSLSTFNEEMITQKHAIKFKRTNGNCFCRFLVGIHVLKNLKHSNFNSCYLSSIYLYSPIKSFSRRNFK